MKKYRIIIRGKNKLSVALFRAGAKGALKSGEELAFRLNGELAGWR
jgi:hypothetical protein